VATLTPRGRSLVGAVAFEVPCLSALNALLCLEPFQLLWCHGGSDLPRLVPLAPPRPVHPPRPRPRPPPWPPVPSAFEGFIVIVVVFIEEVDVVSVFECIEKLFFFLVDVEVVEGWAVPFPICARVVARDDKVMNVVVGRSCLDHFDGDFHIRVEFDPGGEVTVFERADELEELVIFWKRAVEDIEVMDVVLEFGNVSIEGHNGWIPLVLIDLDAEL
jgi:hypothetical protein